MIDAIIPGKFNPQNIGDYNRTMIKTNIGKICLNYSNGNWVVREYEKGKKLFQMDIIGKDLTANELCAWLNVVCYEDEDTLQ